jgi:hypothetical protein
MDHRPTVTRKLSGVFVDFRAPLHLEWSLWLGLLLVLTAGLFSVLSLAIGGQCHDQAPDAAECGWLVTWLQVAGLTAGLTCRHHQWWHHLGDSGRRCGYGGHRMELVAQDSG